MGIKQKMFFIVTLFWGGVLLMAPVGATTITFIHFNDLHAHLTPHKDLVADGGATQVASSTKVVERGGLARSATLIKRIRADNPNSVLMNIGDTYHGGVEALFTNGNAIVDPMNALGVDVGVPGNWDFAYGPLVTRLRYASLNPMEARMLSGMAGMMSPSGQVKRPNFPNLAANVTLSMPIWKQGKTFLPATLVKEIGGVKVGFIGITSDIVPRMHKMLAMGMDFLQGEDNYKALINRHARALRADGAQVVVVMSELGIHKDHQLAQVITPGMVDVIFSAHTHEATFEPLTSRSGTLVVEAGNDGYIGRMDLTVERGQVKQRKWKLMTVDASLPEDPEMKRLVDLERRPFLAANPNMQLPMPMLEQRLEMPINTVVGHTQVQLDRRNALENHFNRSFAEMLKKMSGTELAMTPGFRFDAVVPAAGAFYEDNVAIDGAITLEDVYRFFPVVYTVSTAKVSGERLQAVLEEGMTSVYSQDAFQQSGGWLEGFAGLNARVDAAGDDGKRVLDLRIGETNRPVIAQELYAITGCSRPMDAADELCSYGGFMNVSPLINQQTGAPWSVVDLFVTMLGKGPLQPVVVDTVMDVSHTPVWPVTPFVQPVWQ